MVTSIAGRPHFAPAYVNTTNATTATTSAETLASFTLPGTTLDSDGDGVRITAWGITAANGNNKLVTIKFGANERTIVINGGHNNFIWLGEVYVFRTGATTQDIFSVSHYNAASTAGSSYVESSTATETLAGDITIAVTATTPTAAGDVTLHGLFIEML